MAQGAECSQGELDGVQTDMALKPRLSNKESPMEQQEQHLEPGPTSMPQNPMHQGKEQACASSNWPLKRQVILFYLIFLHPFKASLKHPFISQRFGED